MPRWQVASEGQYQDVASVPPLISEQLVQGVQQDGWASVENIEDVFEYVDPDGVYSAVVLDSLYGDRFTWLRFYAGDTEVGYLFREGTLEQVALVSDGDIHRCTLEGVGRSSSNSGSPGEG